MSLELCKLKDVVLVLSVSLCPKSRLALILASEFPFMHNLQIDLAVNYRLKDKAPARIFD